MIFYEIWHSTWVNGSFTLGHRNNQLGNNFYKPQGPDISKNPKSQIQQNPDHGGKCVHAILDDQILGKTTYIVSELIMTGSDKTHIKLSFKN